jgi:nicotinate-nucleotide adenylyltransferase
VRVGILGGSFDPVHYGHLRAAEWALEAFDLEAVRLIPARQSPFKGPPVASPADRLAMLELASRDNAALSVDDRELERDGPSYTVDTLRAMAGEAPGSRLTLILGSDAAEGLDRWHESDEIRRLAEIRVLGRPGDPAPEPAAAFPGLAISSSEIRAAIKASRSIRYLTPESVRLYIEEKGLYK